MKIRHFSQRANSREQNHRSSFTVVPNPASGRPQFDPIRPQLSLFSVPVRQPGAALDDQTESGLARPWLGLGQAEVKSEDG